MKGYKKFVPEQRRGPKSPLSSLDVGEMWYFPESYYPNLYHKNRLQEKKYGRKFDYLKINNGTVVRRYE